MDNNCKTLHEILESNDDPCEGYYLSGNYSTLDGEPQHFAFRIKEVALAFGSVVIYTIDADDDSITRRRFAGIHPAAEDLDGNGGVWFRQVHPDHGENGLWWCIAPEPHTMGLRVH